MELFQKFGYTYGPQESYALNHIAYVVLGEKKLSYEESGSLKNLYKDDYQKYIDYNMKDVQLVDRLEEKLGLITLAITMAYKGGVNFQDTFGVTAIWESIIFRKLYQSKIITPLTQKYDDYQIQDGKSHIAGGYVKDPVPGKYQWVVSFDLNSLYPNIIVQNNMSPETIVEYPKQPEELARAANETYYRKDFQGVLPKIIEEYYDERVSVKNMMLAAKSEMQKGYTFELDKEINKELINTVFTNAVKKQTKKVLEVTLEKLVSIDFNHNPASAIVDLSLTNVVGKNMGKISAWYDNEWGFSNRMCDIAEHLHKNS